MMLLPLSWQEAEAQARDNSCNVTKTLLQTIKTGLHGKVDRVYIKINGDLTAYVTQPHFISCRNGVVKFTNSANTIRGTVYTSDENVTFYIRADKPEPAER